MFWWLGRFVSQVLNRLVMIFTSFFQHGNPRVRLHACSLPPSRQGSTIRAHGLARLLFSLLLLVQIRTLAVQAMNLVIVLRPTQLTVSMEGFIQVGSEAAPAAVLQGRCCTGSHFRDG